MRWSVRELLKWVQVSSLLMALGLAVCTAPEAMAARTSRHAATPTAQHHVAGAIERPPAKRHVHLDVVAPASKLNRADRWAASMRARAAHVTSPAKARRLVRRANLIEYLFGHETMDTSSFEFSLIFILKIPGLAALGNVAFHLRKWFPSAEYRREVSTKGWKEPIWGYTTELASIVGAAGYDSVTGPFMPGVVARGFGTGIGIPNYAKFLFGEVDSRNPSEYNRGPYLGGAAQILPLGFGGLSVKAVVYYRPALALTRLIRPIYDKLKRATVAVGRWMQNAGRWMMGKKLLAKPESLITPPPTTAPTANDATHDEMLRPTALRFVPVARAYANA